MRPSIKLFFTDVALKLKRLGTPDIIEQLCDQNGTFRRANRSLKQFRVLESIGVKELRYVDPYNHTSLLVVDLKKYLTNFTGHGSKQDSQGGNLYITSLGNKVYTSVSN